MFVVITFVPMDTKEVKNGIDVNIQPSNEKTSKILFLPHNTKKCQKALEAPYT